MPDFSDLIREWYRTNKRDLPWRHVTSPYAIWISEIILQQTRVAQGIGYYYSFLETFPTVHHLANADENDVLRVWQGLGYYSRARNLHHTAKVISRDYNGIFPTTYTELLKLKGIGPYTAAAIASFCFEEAIAVADGNVFRVMSRYFEIHDPVNEPKTRKTLTEYAQELLSNTQPGEHNQAIMELGALVCTPQNPRCEECPVQNSCQGHFSGTHIHLPKKSSKKRSITRYFNYIVFKTDHDVILTKRTNKDIWRHLYEFPLMESYEGFLGIDEIENTYGAVCNVAELPGHVLSHQRIQSRFFVMKSPPLDVEPTWQITPITSLDSYPFSVLITKFIQLHFGK